MPWIIPCPACDHPIRPRPGQRGHWVRCPMCQHRLQIPAVSAEILPATDNPVAPPVSPVEPAVAVVPPPSSGFWRGLVAGVGFVVLAAVVVIGVRGLWPARFTPPSFPEVPDPNLGGALTARPPQGGGGPGKINEISKDVLDPRQGEEHPIGVAVQAPVAGLDSLPPVTQLPPFLAMVSATRTGHMLLSGERGELLLYRQNDLSPVTKLMLKGPAYALALDENRGRLYAAVSQQPRLKVDHLKGRETPPADLHVYDVSAVLQGKIMTEYALKPLKQFTLKAAVHSLLLARDGKQLFCISETARDAKGRRIDTIQLEEAQPMPVRPGATLSLSITPDGRRLFVLAGSRLTAYDPSNWESKAQVVVGLNLFSPVAIDEDRVLLLERQSTWQVVVVDVTQRKALSRWDMIGLEGRPSMVYSPEKKRFYIGTTGVLHGQVWELDCAAEKMNKPVLTRHLQTNHERLLRGPLHVTDNGQYVLLSNGVVLRTA